MWLIFDMGDVWIYNVWGNLELNIYGKLLTKSHHYFELPGHPERQDVFEFQYHR